MAETVRIIRENWKYAIPFVVAITFPLWMGGLLYGVAWMIEWVVHWNWPDMRP